mgnify:CR=1 FL=1
MRPIITITAVVLLHLCVIAVLVGVNGCRSTSGYEKEPDLSAFSAGARTAVPVAPLAHLSGAVAGALAWRLTMRGFERSPRSPHGT